MASTWTDSVSPLVETQKQSYENAIKSLSQPQHSPCVKCNRQPKEDFKQHDRWSRSFRFVVDGFVYTFIAMLVRWKCPNCHRTFTILPSFAAPRKRYVTETIVAKSDAYINNPECSTRQSVMYENMAIGYARAMGEEIDERQLAHSTVWRWTEWLGNQRPLFEVAESLIRQRASDQTSYRESIPISPLKYHSEKRKQTLESASLFIRVSRMFNQLFSRPLFPRFATGP